jgi:alkanesulfonate monooxygenase SsuD/methylene tetrahydromethanopterin reductase-like flavin-dependent oxidoreductase (luciferase family)
VSPTFGLYLNMGANLASTPEGVFDLTRRQTDAAEELGYHDVWVTEHHFIRFGINPSALTASGFLLGRTRRLRVGTAVVLSPLHHPVDLAERAALLDQLGEGRFDLGLGRGGYARDYPALDVDTARWNSEPDATLDAVLGLWRGGPVNPDEPDVGIQPPPRTAAHPPVFLATSSDRALETAATRGVALQHYFATAAPARVALEERYVEAGGDPSAGHVHHLIAIVTDGDVAARDQLRAALTQSFHDGDHPHLPQVPDRHHAPDGTPLDRGALAGMVADGAILGPPAQVVDQLGAFIAETGARRVVLYQEAIADSEATMCSIERFASEVAPQLTAS